MNIILAAKENSEDIYALICELEDEIIDKEKFNRIFMQNIENHDIYYYIAVEDAKAVGFISLHLQRLLHHVSEIGEIQELIVKKEYQKRGIGSALFQQAKETVFNNNCSQLEVCCNQIRKESHVFYEKQGMSCSHFKFCLPIHKCK